MSAPELDFLDISGQRVAYRQLGSGPAVLMIHGWPTHSWLWRDVMPPVAEAGNRAIAIDLPGFGASSKPLNHRYGFTFYDEIIEGFLGQLGIDDVAIAVHDLGGPVGLHWAVGNQERVRSIALLNTLAYPDPSLAVKLFVAICSPPGARSLLTSPRGIAFAMRFGVSDRSLMDDARVRPYQEPFRSGEARRALADTAKGLGPRGFETIEAGLRNLEIPMRIIYGTEDRILPDVGETMERVQRDVADCELTALEGVGHFLQEERGNEIGDLLAAFYAS